MRRLFLFVLLFATAVAADDKWSPKKNAMTRNQDQWVELARVAEVVAEQPCTNWQWAAAMETMLRRQKVDLDQRFWVMKHNGGLVCVDLPLDFEVLKREIDGEYTIGPSHNVRLEVAFRSSLPASTDALLVPLANGRPYMIQWKNRYYIVYGATWDEQVFQTGQKYALIKTLMLIDPSARGEQRKVVFDRLKDNPSDLGGIFEVTVNDLKSDPFAPPHNPALERVPNPAETPVPK